MQKSFTEFFKFSTLIVVFCLGHLALKAQTSHYDSGYVEASPETFLLRFYLSKKYSEFLINAPNSYDKLIYRPNSGNNLGIGFTYQNFTLNIAGPVGFVYSDRKQDFPHYLDLQAHIYPRRMIVDFFGQFYNGFILEEDQLEGSDRDYLRQDIKLRKIGLNVNYLPNGDKLSIQAAFNQSHIQKKSAFSPFYGFEIYGGKVFGDSLLIPDSQELAFVNFQQVDYFQFGPNAGLAGTLVFGNGFFLSGVASANVSLGHSRWQNETSTQTWKVFPTYFLRGFFGYNSRRFSINANYVWKNLPLAESSLFDQSINTGNYRINLIYKFAVGKTFQKKFQQINPIRLISND